MPHIIWTVLAVALGIYATGPIKFPKKLTFLERWLSVRRTMLVGLSAAILAGIHLITFSKTEDVLFLMSFVVILLAYVEMGNLAIRTRYYRIEPAYPEATQNSLKASTRYLALVLGSTLLFSIGTLYASLMSVVGFHSVWTVLIFSVIILGALGLLVRNRNL